MFSVKHVLPTGHESICQTSRVSFQPESEAAPEQVYIEKPDGSVFSITDGTIYVMNDSGKTMETIRLT
jgi:hypothetical protein